MISLSTKKSVSGFSAVLFSAAFYVGLMAAKPAFAQTVTVTVEDLDTAIYELESEPDAITQLALRKIQQALNDSDIRLGQGEVLFSRSDSDITVESGCTRTEIRTVNTSITLASDSFLSLELSSFYEPVALAVELDARVSVNGRAKQVVGFRLGSCQELAEDNFSFSADGSATLALRLELSLNPELDASEQNLVLEPVVRISGQLSDRVVRVNVEDSLLRNILEDYLEDEIDDALADAQIVSAIEDLQLDLNTALENELDDGRLVLALPSPSDEQIESLYSLLSPDADFSLSLGHVRAERVSLLAALILGDELRVKEIVGDAVQCEAAGILQTTLDHQPLFQMGSNGCEAIQLPDADALALNDREPSILFADNQCQHQIDYFPLSTVDYCSSVLDTNRLGNAASYIDELSRWTLSPGTRFDIGAVPLQGLQQPFTQRVSYKTVATPMGECSLEMRIHSELPVSDSRTDLPLSRKAVIAFHGGSWQRRSSGALGIESMATQFVNAGYVVFAPFYRLIGTDEGNESCNNATLEQVLDDAYDALNWVQQNGSVYGVAGKPVLFGQSAGGHLAAVLAVERPDEIANSVLFYAPTDFAEFARRLQSGELITRTGQGILEAVVGQTLDTLDINDPLIQRNSLASRLALSDEKIPPFFLLHGQRDSVLPVSQSVRMCNAIAGDPESGPATAYNDDTDVLRQVIHCGAGESELHLIQQGEHALDLCIAEELCLAGNPQSAALTTDSIRSMLEWISVSGANNASLNDDFTGVGLGNSGGKLAFLSLLFLCLANLFRRLSAVA